MIHDSPKTSDLEACCTPDLYDPVLELLGAFQGGTVVPVHRDDHHAPPAAADSTTARRCTRCPPRAALGVRSSDPEEITSSHPRLQTVMLPLLELSPTARSG